MFEATSRHCGPSCTSCSSTQLCWARATGPQSVPPKQGSGRRRLCQTKPGPGLTLSLCAQMAAAHSEGPSSERMPLLPAPRGPHADLKVK